MPNWCEGTLRLRGKRKDIAEFLKDNIRAVVRKPDSFDTEDYPADVKEEYDGQYVTVSSNRPNRIIGYDWFWIKDTHRNFIDRDPFCVDMYGDENKIYTVCIDGFRAAWGVEFEPYVAFSKKYGLDIKIFGSEQGMQFEQCIEIVNCKLVKDEEYRYEDWDWEAVNPNMGG